MTFIRGVFLFALLMLITGIVGSRYIVAALLGSVNGPPEPRIVAQASRPTATPKPSPTATRTPQPTSTATVTPQPTATTPSLPTPSPTAAARTAPATPTAAMAASVKRIRHQTIHHTPVRGAVHPHRVAQRATNRKRLRHHAMVRKPTPTPAPTALPTPSPTPGIVTLVRYWVGTPDARHGQTISVGYVIDNATGHTAEMMLGASIKGDNVLSWAASLSDPAHDVVADVPPGVSTHVRYFTLPAGLKPGEYAVAWGLRDAVTGERTALVAAPSALQVTR